MNNIICIDDISKYFIWTPQKTGGRLFSNVFENSDFCTYGNYNGYVTKLEKKIIHNNNCDFFTGHQNYKMILTVRNPYSILVSHFKDWDCGFENPTEFKQQFIRFTHEYLHFFIPNSWTSLLKNLLTRKPDYIIRIENLYEDYLKIPIVKKTKFYEESNLHLKLNEIVGRNREKYYWKLVPTDWREYYDRDVADMVYYYFANYFEIFEYDRDSWKKNG